MITGIVTNGLPQAFDLTLLSAFTIVPARSIQPKVPLASASRFGDSYVCWQLPASTIGGITTDDQWLCYVAGGNTDAWRVADSAYESGHCRHRGYGRDLHQAVSFDLDQQLWRQLDQTPFSLELRRHLQSNGFRCGIASTQLPAVLEELADRQQNELTVDEFEGLFAGSSGTRQRLQSRIGEVNLIPTTEVMPALSWMMDDEGYRHGRTCRDAQCQFTLTTYPQPDGQVRVEIAPEILHGQTSQKYTMAHSSFMLEPTREKSEFPKLRIPATPDGRADPGNIDNGAKHGIGESFLRLDR